MPEVNVTNYEEYADFVTKLGSVYSMADDKSKMATAGLGLGGEAGEIANICSKLNDNSLEWSDDVRNKIVDELGDIMWYVAFAARNVLNVNLGTLIPEQKTIFSHHGTITQAHNWTYHLRLIDSCCSVTDMTKKLLYHGKPFNEDAKAKMILKLSEISKWVMLFAYEVCGVRLMDVVVRNVAKLSERYKSLKFTTEEFMAKENKA
jgi:NTP pyrophosphatase (non-canonical NTP hydrolase)